MAFMTAEQAETLAEWTRRLGKPDQLSLEHTLQPYGLLWARWDERLPKDVFIRPDGSRLVWEAA